MPTEPVQLMSVEAYLEFEERSSERHEYVDGIVYVLPGETLRHNQIAGRLYAELLPHVDEKKFRLAFTGIKLSIPALNRFYYPDVMVLCDPRDADDKVFQYPCFIAEVLSPSTAGTDRREKLQAYRTIDTLQGYLMLDPVENAAEYALRTPQGWQSRRFTEGSLEVGYLGLSLELATLFV